MIRWVYDTEVFAHDWLFSTRPVDDPDKWRDFWLDRDGLREFLLEHQEDVFIGFNSKNYDQFIVKGICSGLSPEEVKQVNDFIIEGYNGWECPLLDGCGFRFNNADIFDDCQEGQSLKSIEGHLGMDIEETSVDFRIDRPLTDAERKLTIHYCHHDVDATAQLVKIRHKYLQTKIDIGRMSGIDEIRALQMTNAKLTAAFLKAKPPAKPRTDERQYRYPENLRREFIPQEVFDYFDRMYDPNLSDEEVYGTKLNLKIGGTPTVVGYGGIHAAIPNYVFDPEPDSKRIIRNFDVASFYPHLLTINGYTSRNIPDPAIYAEMLEKRMAAKKSGDTTTANSLKLIANTTYGATLNRFNDLYDALQARSVCISGQLYLIEMACNMVQNIPNLKIVQLNTDGIMVQFEEEQYPQVLAITEEWQQRTGFQLEEDKIARLYQKDVNNYVEVPTGDLYDSKGKPRYKIKGGYLVRGIAPAGAFKVNNNASVVARAIVQYFANGTPVEQTIQSADSVLDFQLIAKAGSKYAKAMHEVDGILTEVQKVNRVYATSDQRYGTLYKLKIGTENPAKIASLPEHCIVDNSNHITMEQIDKGWYITLAKKQINDFLGIKPTKQKVRRTKMANQTTPNVYQRILLARVKFMEAGAKKSGKNMHMKFTYFELEDIVPIATPILMDVGILPVINFGSDQVTMTVFNCEKPEETVEFTSPMKELTGNAAINPLQAEGALETYYRRYMYMRLFDVVEADAVDATLRKDDKPEAPKAEPAAVKQAVEPETPAGAPKQEAKVLSIKPEKKAAPATPQQREEVAQTLANGDAKADDLQIKQMKQQMSALLKKAPTRENQTWLTLLAKETASYTNITKAKWEEVMTELKKRTEAE